MRLAAATESTTAEGVGRSNRPARAGVAADRRRQPQSAGVSAGTGVRSAAVPEPARKAPVMVTRDEFKPTRLGEWTDGADGLFPSGFHPRPPDAKTEGRVRSTQLFAGSLRVLGGDCSQNCRCSILKKTEGLLLLNRKLLNLQGKPHRVSTGGPMCPRRMERSCKSSLFSSTYDTRSWRRAVELC